MNGQTRHFVLTPEGGIREFSAEQAALVAAGARRMPEFAKRQLRYLQVTVLDEPNNEDLRIQTAGACLGFDSDGRLAEARPPDGESEQISRFEHDTCVQWVLRDLPTAHLTFH
ncbi:MAG: hypothetical protein HYV18_02600 [Gammaproteobacteria bacterium]|nr:hypothetical protein [Gammaproteobacteria bacterium]